MDDMVIIKYDLSGNQNWLNRYNSVSNRNDIVNNISIDNSGSIIISGFIAGASCLNDFAIVKFSQITNLNEPANQIATGYYLYQNYPNPFNPSTEIGFSVSKSKEIKLAVYDIMGKEIQILANGFYKPGKYKFIFSAKDLSSGIYLYSLNSGNQTITKKMSLIRQGIRY